MRLALFVVPVFALLGPTVAMGASDASQQGSAVGAMGRVGSGRTSSQRGISIPDYGGDVSAIRRLPIGTTAPRSRSFIPAPRFLVRYW